MLDKKSTLYQLFRSAAIAFGLTGLGVVLEHYLTDPQIFNLFFFLYPAGFFSVWFGGVLGGVLSVLFGSSVAFFQLVQRGELTGSGPWSQNVLNLLIFLFFGILFGVLIGREKKIRRQIGTALRDLKRFTGRVAESEKELRAAVRSRNDFFSIASHELKTPITALKLQTQLLSRQMPSGLSQEIQDRFKGSLKTMDLQINRLTQLVDSLLDITRIAKGSLKLDYEDLDLGKLIKDVFQRYSVILSSAHCTFEIQQNENFWVQCDRFRMEQVFTNLIGNAAKYAPGGKIEVKIERLGDQVQVWFSDNGPGMSPESQASIFAPFKRQVNSEKHVAGLGLGLFIAKQIIRAQSGNIKCRSQLGHGTTFIVTIPLKRKVSNHSQNPLEILDARAQEQLEKIHRRYALAFSDWGNEATGLGP